MPTRTRTARRRPEDRSYRTGCNTSETANHVLQNCPKTHSAWIERHNYLVKPKRAKLRSPHITQHQSQPVSPILVVLKDTITVDAQVIADGFSVERAHIEKTAGNQKQVIRDKFGKPTVTTTTMNLNWRGIWSWTARKETLELAIVKKRDAATISIRTWRRRPPR